MTLLEVRNLSKNYGLLQALIGADLRVAQGEFHGLIGPNGSGKSTFLKCISGAQAPSTGKIILDDWDLTTQTPQRRARAGMSIKFQMTAVLQELSVYDNMLLASQSREPLINLALSRSRKAHHAHIEDTLSRFHLLDRAEVQAGALSHGEQQWLEIAMAMALEPKLLLLDEPTAGMSVEERRATGELLKPLRGQCAIVIVEHDLDFIRNLVDRMTVLDQGKILASGTVDEIQSNKKVQDVYLKRV